MKNVLFATTALIATAGIAAADVTVGGYGYVGVTHDSTATKKTNVAHAVRLTFNATVETDSGIKLGAFTRMTIANSSKVTYTNAAADDASTTSRVENGEATREFEQARVTLDAGSLSVRVGSTHGAAKTLARNAAFYGFNDGGVFAVDNNISGHNDSGNNVLVQYAINDLKLGLSSDVAGTSTEIAAAYTMNGISVGVGIIQNSASVVTATNKKSEWMLKAGYSNDTLSVGLGTNNYQDVNVTGSYNVAAGTTLGVAVQKKKADSKASYGLDVSHDLGGATLSASAGKTAAGATVAGLGVFFSF